MPQEQGDASSQVAKQFTSPQKKTKPFNPPEQQEVVPLPRPPWRNKADFRTSSGTAAVAVDQRHPPPNSAGCWPQTVANGSWQLVGGFRNTGRDEMGQNHSKAWYTAKHPKPKPWQIPTPFWAGYYWCIVWVKIGCPNMWPFCTKHEKNRLPRRHKY